MTGKLSRKKSPDMPQTQAAENEARHTAESFRQLAENITEVFWIGSPDWQQVFYVSPAFEKIWGLPREFLCKNPLAWLNAIPETERRAIAAAIPADFSEPYTFPTYTIVRPDGSQRIIEARAYPIKDDQGKTIRVAGIAQDITEKKAYEHSLYEVETRFRAFMDNAPFHAYIKNSQGQHVYGNLKSLRDLGMTLEEFQRTTVDDIFPEQIAKRIKEYEEKVFRTGKPLFVPEATVSFDGKERWVEEVKFPFHGQSGEMYLGGISLDVTDRKLSQLRLQESENRYRTLFENMTQGVFYQNREGKFLDANKAALDILGFERDVFLKEASAEWPWKMLDEHGQELLRDERPSLKALSTGRPVINSIVAVFNQKKNDYVWLNVNAIPLFRDGEEKPYQVFITQQDITKSRQEEEKIAFLSNVFVNLDVNPVQNIAMIVNETGRLLQGAACLYNRLDDEKKSLCVWASLNAPPDLEKEDIPDGHICYEATIKGQSLPVVLGELLGSVYEKTDVNVKKYGLRSYLGYPVRLGGQAIGALCIVDVKPREFTETEIHVISTLAKAISLEEERRRSEEALAKAKEDLERRVQERTLELQLTYKQLLHAEKLSAVGQLSASIAHEFNNPLQGILNIVSGIKRRAPLSLNDSLLIDMAVTECERMKELIKGLQDFNRPSSGKPVQADIGKIIDAVLLLTRKEFETKNIQVEKVYGADLPAIKVIADQIKQVLLNLLTNAADACSLQGGFITIRTETVGDQLAIRVADTGKGIKADDLEHIFEPFFSTKPEVKGVGLGLSVSYGIVKRHGGDILVESTEGNGATFTVLLPIGENHDEK